MSGQFHTVDALFSVPFRKAVGSISIVASIVIIRLLNVDLLV
jgi:hypothetical protein